MPLLELLTIAALCFMVHSFSSQLLIYHGSLSYHRSPRLFAVQPGYDKAFELGSLLLERLERGQVSKDVALPGVPMDLIPSELFQILQSLEQNQDLISLAEFQVSTPSTPFYLSNYSTSPSCRWVKILPQLQGLFREAFQAVVDSYQYYNLSNSSTTIQLSPYDLFHGHLFRRSFYYYQNPDAASASFKDNHCTGIQELDNQEGDKVTSEQRSNYFQNRHHQLGILFHCCEYPAIDNPHGILANISLGYHQIGSNCHPTLEEWKFRNVLWLVGWEQQRDSDEEPSYMLEPKIWLLNGSAPEISQLQVDGGPFELFGPESPNTVWEGFLVGANNMTPTDDFYHQSSGLVADIYYGMEDHDGSIWCETC